MNSVTYVFAGIFILFIMAVILIIVGMKNSGKIRQPAFRGVRAIQNYRSNGHRYVSSQFSDQMELDMRLPYRRFRQLYPETRWTYEEYKKMQTQTAYRHSLSSQNNKRMVR